MKIKMIIIIFNLGIIQFMSDDPLKGHGLGSDSWPDKNNRQKIKHTFIW